MYLGLIFLLALVLTVYRRKELRPERTIVSYLSREAFFLINNLVLLSLCFTITWGVLFPPLSVAVTGTKQTVGIPFFNAVTIPMFLILLLLMGVGPLIAWQKASVRGLWRTFWFPFVAALLLAVLLVWAGVTQFYPILTYSLCWFVLMSIFGEVHRGLRAQRTSESASQVENAARLLRRNHVRYGGYLVHFGVLVVTVAITASMAHKVEREFSIAPGESYLIGRFKITLDRLFDRTTSNYAAFVAQATLASAADGARLGVLVPEMRRYRRNDESTSEVALHSSIREDVYLVLAGLDQDGKRAAFKVFINPLQVWLWIGAAIMIFGTVVVLIPRRRPQQPAQGSV